MLVLSRKKLESIVIDEQIIITVVEIRGDKVRLGIEAPRDISIKRCELEDRHQSEPPVAGEAAVNGGQPVPDHSPLEKAQNSPAA